MTKKILTAIIGIILGLAILVPRFSNLSSTPPGLHIDEVSFAADAKAIAETGRDTWNQPWPLVFKAFGEWKAPGLVYSMAFWSRLLGGRMDNTVARLPSAVAGIVMLITLYFTMIFLLGIKSKNITLATVLILAFSPWHFDMSRIFYEAFSAGALMALSLMFLIKSIMAKDEENRNLVYSSIFAALAGYWYASVRYGAFAILGLAAALTPTTPKKRAKTFAVVITTIIVVGIGWMPELFSNKGLTRLHFYQEKSALNSTLNIDEKRQFCYLSFSKSPEKAKICYVFWNKPLFTLINIGKTYLSYLGPDFLFMSSGAEYGFDGYYGAYLLPLFPIYLVGVIDLLIGTIRYLTSLLNKKKDKNNGDKVSFILVSATLISLFPAAISAYLTPRMGVLLLYIAAVTIGIGLYKSVIWIKQELPRLAIPIYIIYVAILIFFISQSLLHYFAVFTRSNDWAWTSDSEIVFSYVSKVLGKYDRVIDTTLHGPLAPYFYGDITTEEIQNGIHTVPDLNGWTFLERAGKYELLRRDIRDLACEKWGTSDKRKTLVITQKVAGLDGVDKFEAKTWNGVEVMHEVYDLDLVVAHELDHNTSFKGTCTAKAK